MKREGSHRNSPVSKFRKRPSRSAPGRPFKAGTNSDAGEVFRRGPDRVARGTVRSLYRALLDDDGDLAEELLAGGADAILPFRSAIARSLLLGANDSKQAATVAEIVADRLE